MSKATEAMKKANTRHGYAKVGSVSPTYKVWQGMKKRCQDKNSDRYPFYGGRGIKVCERWELFENFLADMGERPKGKTLERIDNSGDYTPENVKWATRQEQANNRRSSRLLSYNGEVKTTTEWSRITGVNAGTIHSRLKRGWEVGRALTEGHSYKK